MWNNHITTKALPCINSQQIAAKTIWKYQQTPIVLIILQTHITLGAVVQIKIPMA